MREILFRGKRVDNGEWVEGSFLKVTLNGKTAHLIFGDNFAFVGGDVKALSHALVDPSTVGQYTGLTANGKKILEGDILSGYFSAGVCVNGLVEFKDGSFGISWKWGDGRQFAAFTSITHSVEFEVIGNCHDNPELLEVSHE